MYPLFLVIFGRSATTIVMIGFAAGLPPVILKTIEGLAGTRKVLIDVGRSFRARRLRSCSAKILLPAALPSIFVGLRVGLIFAMINIVGVEFLINFGGLGQLINELAERYDLPGTYGAIGFVILVSVALLRRLRARRAMAAARQMTRRRAVAGSRLRVAGAPSRGPYGRCASRSSPSSSRCGKSSPNRAGCSATSCPRFRVIGRADRAAAGRRGLLLESRRHRRRDRRSARDRRRRRLRRRLPARRQPLPARALTRASSTTSARRRRSSSSRS